MQRILVTLGISLYLLFLNIWSNSANERPFVGSWVNACSNWSVVGQKLRPIMLENLAGLEHPEQR